MDDLLAEAMAVNGTILGPRKDVDKMRPSPTPLR